MEWRQQTSVSCEDAFSEAQRWIQEVTGKSFGCNDFRAALENGVLLCDLINQLKPGIIKRVNRLSTPIAGLDNVNVFLKACGKLGLNDSQLFHPGDLQNLSTRVTLRRDESKRRLKNVLITIYWLGRKAQIDTFYSGPQLNFKAFEGLLGLALSKALEEGSNAFVREAGCGECRLPDGEECQLVKQSCMRGTSMDSIESLDTYTARHSDGGCGSDAEAEQVYKMDNTQPAAHQSKGYIPPPLRRKQGRGMNSGGSMSPLPRTYKIQVRPETPVQVNPGWIWSKSLNDIPMVYPVRKVSAINSVYDKDQNPVLAREWSQETKRRCSVAAKDSEAQWQEDLTKWKNRRRSIKSELHRKSQDREHVIDKMTNETVISFEKNDAKRIPVKRDQSPRRYDPALDPFSTSPSKPSSYEPRPHSRALLARSFATEASFSPTTHTWGSSVEVMPASDGGAMGRETYFATLASDGTGVTTPSADNPFTSQTQLKALGSQAAFQSTSEPEPQHVLANQLPSLVTTTQPDDTIITWDPPSMSSHNKGSICIDSKDETIGSDLANPVDFDATEDFTSLQSYKYREGSRKSSGWQPARDGKTQQAAGSSKYLGRTGSWSSSASLPRGYRRSESLSHLSSITPRPFGVKQSRVSALPKLLNVDDNQGFLLNSEKGDSFSSTKPPLKRQMAAAHLRGQYQASVKQKKAFQAKLKGTEEGNNASLSSQTPLQTTGYPQQPSTPSQILPQPYTKLQSHNRSLSLSSTASPDISKVDHSDMRVSLTLKPNSVPDFGFHTHWDSTGARIKFIQPGSPAELCRLCVDDEIVAVDGVAVTNMNYNQWKDKMASCLQTGTLTMDIRRYGIKDWSTSEGNHHSQPVQSRMTLNLTTTAPMLIGRPDYHASSVVSTEMADTQESKLSGEAHNAMHVKAMDGDLYENHNTARSKDNITKNQKRRAEFFKRRGFAGISSSVYLCGGSESAISDLQVPSLGPSSSSWSWDHEEDRRRQEKWQEEQERLLQEQYKRDQERLQAEWQRAEQAAMSGNQTAFEMASGHNSFGSAQFYMTGWTKKPKEKQSHAGDQRRAEVQSCVQGVQNDKIPGRDWPEGCYDFAPLSPACRAKSLSTPVLTGPYKQTGGSLSKRKGLGMTTAERDRQQILEEMKKKTPLLTDNSWIRQRRSSFHKEPIYVGVSMKRYESLDDLDSIHRSADLISTSTYPRPNSAAGRYCTPSRNAFSRYSTGSLSSQKNAYAESSNHGSVNMYCPRTVSGTRTCGVCERVQGSGAAMIIEALSLYFHLNCFKCVGCGRNLRGTKTRVRVRVQNEKPYCDHCYFHLKSTDVVFM
ncbi:LIM domain only protein 7b isoform X2 [Cololabis saira]|uniref:LIM domain only protein 7b isoform X2 n=1 Tax=Cololabis saira TaxID=129043 RepID=UPI002AD4EF86|nr:LIM domain only protein 7b isoform X2 [Cololabis saira]